MVLCPSCRGHEMVPVFVKSVEGEKADLEALVKSGILKCQLCKGEKEVTEEVAARYARGQAFANKRKLACYGPREYAETMGLLPSDLLKMEAGLIEPVPFMEPPVLMTNIPVTDVRDLVVARDHARKERDWLRLLFIAEAQGLVYENDEKTHRQVSTRMVLVVDQQGVPVYNEQIEKHIEGILQEREHERQSERYTEGEHRRGFRTPASGQ